MSNVDFSFKRDFNQIKWKETLWLNFLRALFAGPIWTIVMLSTGEPFSVAGTYLMFPLLYFVGALPIGLIGSFLSGLGVPFAGWFTILCSLLVVVGDPFVFVIHKVKPNLVPVEKFSIFNFKLIIFVLDTVTQS